MATALPPELDLPYAELDVAHMRSRLLARGLVRITGLATAAEVAAVRAHVAVHRQEESWSRCGAGRAIVARVREILERAFGFVLLDPFRYEEAPGGFGDSPRSEIKAMWHRDNWPVTGRLASERRYFFCRPILLFDDLESPALGPTEVVLDSHWLREQARTDDTHARVLMLGHAGDLWLMASRALHRRAFAERTDGAAPVRLRRVAWMVAKTEARHP